MAWTTPKTDFASGNILTAAQMNAIGENLLALRTADVNVVQVPLLAASDVSQATNTWSANLLSGSITPTATSSKVLVQYVLYIACSVATPIFGRILRGSTVIDAATGDAASNRPRVNAVGNGVTGSAVYPLVGLYIDSPASTSAQTYNVQVRHSSALTRTVYINRSELDTNDVYTPRPASFMTLMEIPA